MSHTVLGFQWSPAGAGIGNPKLCDVAGTYRAHRLQNVLGTSFTVLRVTKGLHLHDC
jgi:hypothetical protein